MIKFEPIDWMEDWIELWAPWPIETMMMTELIPMIMPSMVKEVLTLLAVLSRPL